MSFTGKKDFEERLHHFSQSLNKVSEQRDGFFVSTRHTHRSSNKLLIRREKEEAEKNLEIVLESDKTD